MLSSNLRDLQARPEKESGFSLVELMISMVVLSIGLVSIVGILTYVTRANADSNITSVLATTIQTEVDQLRSAHWSVSACDPALQVGGSLTSNSTGYFTTLTGTAAGDLIVRWQVAQGASADYRIVTVNVKQALYSADFRNGMTVTTIILRQ